MTFRASSRAAGLICLLIESAAAQTGSIRVLASNGMKAVVLELQPQIERAAGHPLAIEFNSTAALQQKINGGAAFDMAILTSEAIGELVKAGKATVATRTDFAKCGIGVAVRSGSPKPDIGTAAAMKRTLRDTKSIAYARDGASRIYIDKMLERLGLVEETKPKIILTQGSGPAMASVASGQAAMVITLMSELLPIHGIDVVGPLPGDLQSYVAFGAAAGVNAANPAAAKAVIAFLKSAEAAPVYKAKGMQAVGADDSLGAPKI